MMGSPPRERSSSHHIAHDVSVPGPMSSQSVTQHSLTSQCSRQQHRQHASHRHPQSKTLRQPSQKPFSSTTLVQDGQHRVEAHGPEADSLFDLTFRFPHTHAPVSIILLSAAGSLVRPRRPAIYSKAY